MRRTFFYPLVTLVTAMFIMAPFSALYADVWVVSSGDTVYNLNAKGIRYPNVIPGLTQVQAAEVDPKRGIVWISVSAANTVFRYDPADTSQNAFKSIPNINRPGAISINPSDGAVWVAGVDSVKKISADGSQILATITGVHEPNVAVNTADASCWVTDSRGKVARYDASGNLVVSSPVILKEPKYVTVNPKTGNVWVADSQANILVKLNSSGQELKRITDLQLPTSPRINPKDGSLWVVASSNTLVKLSADGQKILEVPAGMAILGICVDPTDGGVWVADQFGSSFQGGVSKFSATGQKLFESFIPLPSYVSAY